MTSFQPVRMAHDTQEPVDGADPELSPVIYLHGMTAFKETWEEVPQIVANATKRMSYSLDARNHGESEWSDQFDFDTNTQDLIHFMDTQGIKKAIIVGHSMGGITAIKAALRMPDRVEKIVVEDMTVRGVAQDKVDVILTFMGLIRKALEEAPTELDEDEVKKHIMQHMLTNMPPELKDLASVGRNSNPEDNTRFLALKRTADGRYTSKCNLEVIEKCLRKMEPWKSEPEGLFEGPACFIYGKLSPFSVAADEQHIKQFFPNAILEGVDDVGHDVHNSKPLEFTDILLKFLS